MIFLEGCNNTQSPGWRHVCVEFRMTAVFEGLCRPMSVPIHKCVDRSNPLGIGRDAIFWKMFVIG